MFDWVKKKFAKSKKVEKVEKPVREKPAQKTPKELATEAGEPYIAILKMDIDPANLHQGAFELDWNDIFVARLVRAGYQMKPTDTDADLVDRWFQNICRHVVMETWEQEQAIKESGSVYVRSKDIGNGRSEVS